MLKNIVFDLGNVLIEWNMEKVLNGITKDETIKSILKKEIFDSGIWEDIDAGNISILEAEEKIKKNIDEKYFKYLKEVLWKWYNYVDVKEETFRVIKKLYQENYKIFILSNTSELYYKILEKRMKEIEKCISGAVLSYEEKLKKPDERIYKRFLEKFSLKAEECVFFDDLEINVQEAIKSGIKSYVFNDDLDIMEIIENFK